MPKIVIGIPCYDGVSSETLEDYMRLSYYLGRRYPEYEFFLSIKSKSEQFRARNAIVEASFQVGADYILMMDDDMVIDWHGIQGPSESYDFLHKLLKHLDEQPSAGIVGVLYYQRGGECRPVLMKQGKDGAFHWLRDDEIKKGIQEVAVAGGGCFLAPISMYEKVEQPWFEPELQLGTDIQICKKAKEAGFKIYADTSIELGHVKSSREIITSKNRSRVYSEHCQREGINRDWSRNSAMMLYKMDVEEYTGLSQSELIKTAKTYDENMSGINYTELVDYYKARGLPQLARQYCFHQADFMIEQMETIHNMIDTNIDGYGLDFGCGSAPVGFELALRGHRVDFHDINGAFAYEFTKWRSSKRNIKSGFEIVGPYDYVLCLDSIEHIKDWKGALNLIVSVMKKDGVLITNYFFNNDYENPEHVSMDKDAVREHLVKLGVYPINDLVWVKKIANKAA